MLSIVKKIQTGHSDHRSSWKLRNTPTIGFYTLLHHYLKRHPSLPKLVIGKLYCTIDDNFQEKESRPDNIYRFVDNIVSSKIRLSNDPMPYNIPVIKSTGTMLKYCTKTIQELNAECADLRAKMEVSRSQLMMKSRALRDVTNENRYLANKNEVAKIQIGNLKAANTQMETECTRLEMIENLDLEEFSAVSTDNERPLKSSSADDELTLQNIIGHRKYSPEIRKLYYNLLAEQVSVSKIADIIKAVLKCFNPSIDVEELRLPKKTCASYMRKDELKTISDCHKVHIICQDASDGKGIYLNTDGTTKQQRKLGGIVANGMVLGVNEIADGKAITAVKDISNEFQKLRKVAKMLGIGNADSINWTLVKSFTSDSASTQKRLNKLIEERRISDEETFGPANCTSEMLDLIETFCSMHLEINLRKAFLNGTVEMTTNKDDRYHRVDSFVHEFCKLFGKIGVPEYGCGISFPDFLEIQAANTTDAEQEYYLTCLQLKLHRQVGSRYFVSAANAVKILFFKDAAIEFLKFTGKNTTGNKLEQAVNSKLHDPVELAYLEADSLMYYHVYADLYCSQSLMSSLCQY